MIGGNLVSHHSQFSVNPASSYGVIVLVAGQYANTAQLAHEAIKRFQSVFDHLQERAARDAFEGLWVSGEDEEDQAVISTHDGALWVRKLVVKGTNILAIVQDKTPDRVEPMALWSTGTKRVGEFRIGFGRPALNGQPLAGCEPYWVSIDTAHANGAPIDLLYFEQDEQAGRQVLKVPSVGVTLRRVVKGG